MSENEKTPTELDDEYDWALNYKPKGGYGVFALVASLMLVATALLVVVTSRYGDDALSSRWLSYAIVGFIALQGMAAGILELRRFRAGNQPLILSKPAEDIHIRRRRRNKRWNERLKLAANGFNAIGASALLALTIVPTIQSGNPVSSANIEGLAIAFGSHIFGQLVLTLWRTEE